MDLKPGTGDNLNGKGRKGSVRDSADQEARSAEDGRDRHETAKSRDGDQSVRVQRNSDDKTAKSNSGKRKKRKTIRWATESPASRRQQDLRFQEELEQLFLRNLQSVPRTQAPPRKPYQPYLFNSLRPYYSTSTISYLAGPPPEVKGHRSRRTAHGLIEPWIDLQMDNDLQSDTNTDPVSHGRLDIGGNSSRTSRRKFLTDYQQTRDHFYRSQLHRLDQVPPAIRQHVRTSYLAYLQNSPGSRRAINDCMRRLTLLSCG